MSAMFNRLPVEQWKKEDVQQWFKNKGWEDHGKAFCQANGNALAALSKDDFIEILGDAVLGRAVYAALQQETIVLSIGTTSP